LSIQNIIEMQDQAAWWTKVMRVPITCTWTPLQLFEDLFDEVEGRLRGTSERKHVLLYCRAGVHRAGTDALMQAYSLATTKQMLRFCFKAFAAVRSIFIYLFVLF